MNYCITRIMSNYLNTLSHFTFTTILLSQELDLVRQNKTPQPEMAGPQSKLGRSCSRATIHHIYHVQKNVGKEQDPPSHLESFSCQTISRKYHGSKKISVSTISILDSDHLLESEQQMIPPPHTSVPGPIVISLQHERGVEAVQRRIRQMI